MLTFHPSSLRVSGLCLFNKYTRATHAERLVRPQEPQDDPLSVTTMPTTCGQPGTSSQIRAGVFAPRDAQHKSLHKCDRGARAQAHVTPRSAMLPLDPRHRHTGIEASCSPTPGFCANRNVPRTPALAPLLTPSGPHLRSVHGSLDHHRVLPAEPFLKSQTGQKWLSPKCSVQNAAAFFDFPRWTAGEREMENGNVQAAPRGEAVEVPVPHLPLAFARVLPS